MPYSGEHTLRNRHRFTKTASDPVPIPEESIEKAISILKSGRLFRYGEETGVMSEAALLERDFAGYMAMPYAAAVNSCGCALFLALKALGVKPGDDVLCNSFTLAPVPGAIVHAGANLKTVDITGRLAVDLEDLERKIEQSDAKVFLLSHMRGHFGDVSEIIDLCDRYGVSVVEDCAHTLGADWAGRKIGTYGAISCFSAQTFKHINSGEGGVIATRDPELAAKIILMSGSYMLYPQSGAAPPLEVFEPLRDRMPNFSMRMSSLTAAIIRPQLTELPAWIKQWNSLYKRIEAKLSDVPGLRIIPRLNDEHYVGSSIQFCVENLDSDRRNAFVQSAKEHGVFLKAFGAERTDGFTSRYDQWLYAPAQERLQRTDSILSGLMDMRIALSFTLEDCDIIAAVIRESLEDVYQR